MILLSTFALVGIILAALLVGGCAGFLLAAMMCAAGSADRDAAYLREIRRAREAGEG